MEVRVQAKLNHEVSVDIHMDDIVEAIDSLPISRRYNYIGMLLNDINLDDIEKLSSAQKKMIKQYLEKQLKRFSDETN